MTDNVRKMADYEQYRKPSDFHEWANAKLEAMLNPAIGGALHLRQPSDLLALADAYASPINMITGKLRKQDMRSALTCVAILMARKHSAPPDFPECVDLAPLPSDWREYLPYIPDELAAVFDVN